MSTVAIIPARGGSKRIPRKNIRMFHGKPIIAYSIEAALESNLFDAVIVSTDDPEIADVSKQYGAEVWKRSARLADDLTGTQEVAVDVLKSAQFDIACVIYATAPLMSIDDLKLGLGALMMGDTNFTFAVGTTPVLHDAGQFYWGHSASFLAGVPLWDRWSRMIPIHPSRDCDINIESDWLRAEQMYEELTCSK